MCQNQKRNHNPNLNQNLNHNQNLNQHLKPEPESKTEPTATNQTNQLNLQNTNAITTLPAALPAGQFGDGRLATVRVTSTPMYAASVGTAASYTRSSCPRGAPT